MTFLRTISEIGLAANGFGTTHDVVRKMHHTYVQPLVDKLHSTPPVKLTVDVPSAAVVDVPITLSGTGVGMVRIYSGDVFERDVYVQDKKWATRLFFSKPGLYRLEFIDTYNQTAAAEVAVSP